MIAYKLIFKQRRMSNKLSKIGLFLPHIYFTIIAIVTVSNPNFVMIGIAIFLLAMIYFKNKILNVSVAAFLLFFSFWMLLAYLSDFHKITTFDTKAWKFMIIGTIFIFANFSMSILMGFPFFKEQIELSEEEEIYTFKR